MASAVRSEADQRVVGNLPLELTSFVGRRRELADARRLFETSHGAWLVELGEQTDSDLLEDHVAVTLGVRSVSSADPLQALIDYCADRSLLLVLDNCEHLVDAVAVFVGAILRRCAGVKILATSRESLGLGGEVTMRVPSLTTPQQQPPEFEGIAQYESVSLFTERAASVVPGFTLTEENKRAVAHICHDLDGLPLPIELAAARLRGMSAEQIMNRLSDRYRLLTTGGRDVPSRQQTLRLSIDWSYDLCSPTEQQLWGRLSVFSGGFDLDAAEGVCGQDMNSTEVLDLVTALVEKSILIREETDGDVRYHLLDLLREYGHEKLESAGEYSALRRSHRDWFEALVVHAEAEWISGRQAAWIARLGREQRNVNDALEYSISTAGEARSATRMVVDVLAIDAVNHAMQGELERAEELVDESWRLANDLADVRSRGLATWGDGYVDTFRGNFDTATAKLESALTLFRLDKNLLHVVIGLDTLGVAYFLSGALDRSVECNEEILAITVPADEMMFQAFALGTLGLVSWLRGELDAASDYLTRSLRILDAPMNSAWCIEPLAWIAAAQRDWKHAAVLLGAAAMYWQKVGGRLAGLPGLSAHHDTAAETARKAMGDDTFDKSFRSGFAMSEGEAVAYALDKRSSVTTASSAEGPHLTPREQQVAELVAQGLTNRAIAEHLVISLRTAQGHVEHVLTKLGFSSRAQIAAWYVSTAQERDSREVNAVHHGRRRTSRTPGSAYLLHAPETTLVAVQAHPREGI
eukprot:gene22458-26935_t